MKRVPVVGVIGSGAVDDDIVEIAFSTGQAIGRAGCHLLCGGRGGVMKAACEGHHDGRSGVEPQGVTIGILPGIEHDEANEFVDIAIPTGIGLARNAIVASGSQGVIAVAGGSGTLSEIALAWQLGRPVATILSSGGWAARLAGKSLDRKRGDTIFLARSPDEAIAYILGELARTN